MTGWNQWDGIDQDCDGSDCFCGNGVIENILNEEACDDGNLINTDSCTNNCKQAICGDGYTWVGNEECDEGGETASCDLDCTYVSCGDNTVNVYAGELCDDGNISNTDSCVNNCMQATCGDGYVWVGTEDCDDGGETARCDYDCTYVVCGDGMVNFSAGEDCDDGNRIDTDSCPNDCLLYIM